MIATNEHMPLGTPRLSAVMSKRSDNRRDNLRRLVEEYDGPANLAKKLGYTNSSFLVQMTGPHPTREVTEKTARKYEEALGLEEGSLDWPPKAAATSKRASAPAVHEPRSSYGGAQPQVSGDTLQTSEIIQLVAQLCEQEKLNLPPVKFADVVSFVLQSGMPPTPETIKRFLSLVAK